MKQRKAIERWMREEDIGVLLHIFLWTLSVIYSAGVRLRLLMYDNGWLKKKRLPCKVISIGNITVGGTGKTPVAMSIAELLKKNGKRVVILSRGYKRKASGAGLVSDGKKMLLGPEEAGDEPYLMAARLKDVPVIVSPDRHKGGLFACERFKPDVIILDDGFQHIKLERDLDILLVDSHGGFGNGCLLPRGILREPLSGIKRADVVFIKGGRLSERDLRILGENPAPALHFGYRPSKFVDIKDKTELKPDDLKEKRAVIVSGIANPDSFLKSVEELEITITKRLSFPDHHDYGRSDIDLIGRACVDADMILTTEKDGVKLTRFASHLKKPVFALTIAVRFEEEEKLSAVLLPYLGGADA